MTEETDFDRERKRMVDEQLEPRGIRDKAVLNAFRRVPRENFVPAEYKGQSYGDFPIPIGSGQTISQPYMVALMTEMLKLKKRDRVLEVGTGSGYQAAILAELCSQLYTIERVTELAHKAQQTLKALGYENIKIKVDDGSSGWQAHAPYDGIIVTCGSPAVPKPLKEQLSPGGRLIIPVGDSFSQVLTVVQRKESGFTQEELCGCLFVPLIGRYGWERHD